MDFSGLRGVPRQSPRRRAVYLHNPSETHHVKKHFGLLVRRTLMGSPCVDSLDFSVKKGLEEAHKNRRPQQEASFWLVAVLRCIFSLSISKKSYLMSIWLPVYVEGGSIIHSKGWYSSPDSKYLVQRGSALHLGNHVATCRNGEWMGEGGKFFLCSFPVGWHPCFCRLRL